MGKERSIPKNEKETLDFIDDSTEQVDEQRLAGLQEAKDTQLIKNEILQREKKRLAVKHGENYPEVQEAENRISYNEEMFSGLDREIEKASIKTDPLPDNAWRVHGRVFDENNKPVKGMTVFLADQKKGWIEPTGNSCTIESGYYSLTVDERILGKLDPKQPFYLSVSDKNKRVIYFAKEPLFASKGLIDYEDIYLREEDCVPPPTTNPTPGPSSTTEPKPTPTPVPSSTTEPKPTPTPVPSSTTEPKPTPTPVPSSTTEPKPTPAPVSGSTTVPNPRETKLPAEIWVVRGKVTNEKDEVQEGIIVSLFDKDNIFTERLGTAVSNPVGDYRLIYRTDTIRELFEKAPELFVRALDVKGNILFSSKKGIRPAAGKEEIVDIKLTGRK